MWHCAALEPVDLCLCSKSYVAAVNLSRAWPIRNPCSYITLNIFNNIMARRLLHSHTKQATCDSQYCGSIKSTLFRNSANHDKRLGFASSMSEKEEAKTTRIAFYRSVTPKSHGRKDEKKGVAATAFVSCRVSQII